MGRMGTSPETSVTRHRPSAHVPPHAIPQPPQLASSVCSSTHVPAQRLSPLAQETTPESWVTAVPVDASPRVDQDTAARAAGGVERSGVSGSRQPVGRDVASTSDEHDGTERGEDWVSRTVHPSSVPVAPALLNVARESVTWRKRRRTPRPVPTTVKWSRARLPWKQRPSGRAWLPRPSREPPIPAPSPHRDGAKKGGVGNMAGEFDSKDDKIEAEQRGPGRCVRAALDPDDGTRAGPGFVELPRAPRPGPQGPPSASAGMKSQGGEAKGTAV